MIDVSPMRDVAFDDKDGSVRIGGGVRNGHIYAGLKSVGRTLTHGRCMGVGAAGFLLGGGIGFAMRNRGLGCDHVVATDVVLADGSMVTASERENADLFWACRWRRQFWHQHRVSSAHTCGRAGDDVLDHVDH